LFEQAREHPEPKTTQEKHVCPEEAPEPNEEEAGFYDHRPCDETEEEYFPVPIHPNIKPITPDEFYLLQEGDQVYYKQTPIPLRVLEAPVKGCPWVGTINTQQVPRLYKTKKVAGFNSTADNTSTLMLLVEYLSYLKKELRKTEAASFSEAQV
jgi:hypothetical protein